MRGRSPALAVVAALLALILSASGALPQPTASTTVLLAEDFAAAPDWSFEGMWHLHDRPGDPTGAAYFGFDNEPLGGYNPDNLHRCEGQVCDGELISPWISLPADRPVFLYVWAMNIVANVMPRGSENTPVWVETETQRTLLYEAAPDGEGESYKESLGKWRGQSVRLVFDANNTDFIWGGGYAIDSVVVTDEDIDMIRTLTVEGAGPSMLAELRLTPGQTAVVRYTFTGLYPDMGRHMRLVEIDGETRGIGRVTYNIHVLPFEGAVVGAAGLPAQGYDGDPTGDRQRDHSVLHFRAYQDPVTVRIGAAGVGFPEFRQSMVIETATGLNGLGAATGGKEVLAATAMDIPAGAFVSTNDWTDLMLDGHTHATSEREALAWFEIQGQTVEATASTPGRSVSFPDDAWWEKASGDWALDIERIIEGYPGHFAMVVELPEASTAPVSAPTQAPPEP